jgi:hypothetical protein
MADLSSRVMLKSVVCLSVIVNPRGGPGQPGTVVPRGKKKISVADRYDIIRYILLTAVG